MEALYVLAGTTGMRQGELLGLRGDDVDLVKGVVRVNKTLWKGETTSPKTASTNRSIRLTRMAVKALKWHKDNGGGSRLGAVPSRTATTLSTALGAPC